MMHSSESVEILQSYTSLGETLGEDELRATSQSITQSIKALDHDDDLQALHYLFRNLIQTSQAKNISFAHAAAALNALCAFLDAASLADRHVIRNVFLSDKVWIAAFQVYATCFDNYKPKPLRRLLETLTNLLSRFDDEDTKSYVIDHVTMVCVKALIGLITYVAIKPSLQVLEHFLKKDIVSAHFIVSTSAIPAVAPNSSAVQVFYVKILGWLQYRDCAPAVGRFVKVFIRHFHGELDAYGKRIEQKPAILWLEPVKYYISHHPDDIERIEHHILGPVLSFLQLGLESIFESQSSNDADIHLQLLIVRTSLVGREIHRLQGLYFSLQFLDHGTASIRLTALSNLTLLIQKINLDDHHLSSRLEQCIGFFHQETSPSPRNEFISLMTKLCTKIKKFESGDLPYLEHTSTKVLPSNPKKEIKSRDIRLLKWYMGYLVKELRPAGTYQGHLTALSMLRALSCQDSNVSGISLFSVTCNADSHQHESYIQRISRPLVDLLFDPFDDVRELSFMLLQMLVRAEIQPPNGPSRISHNGGKKGEDKDEFSIVSLIMQSLPKADTLYEQSGRASQADGLAKLFNLSLLARRECTSLYSQKYSCQTLLYRLETEIESTLYSSGSHSSTPLYGYFTTLR